MHEVLSGYCPCTRRSGGTAHEGGNSQFIGSISSLTPLSVAGCRRLQQGVAHWATSIALQVVDN